MPKRSRPPRRGTPAEPDDAPLVVNGWSLYVWTELGDRWTALRAEATRLRARDPMRYRHHPATKMLAMLGALMLREIPANPDASVYRLGHAFGKRLTHWRRAKFFHRFRLFFRYHSGRRAIVYVWLNDEHTLRKAGSRTDVYAVFAAMLARGEPPDDFDELVRASRALSLRGGDV